MLRFVVTLPERSYCTRASSFDEALRLEPGESLGNLTSIVCLEPEHTCRIPLSMIKVYKLNDGVGRVNWGERRWMS